MYNLSPTNIMPDLWAEKLSMEKKEGRSISNPRNFSNNSNIGNNIVKERSKAYKTTMNEVFKYFTSQEKKLDIIENYSIDRRIQFSKYNDINNIINMIKNNNKNTNNIKIDHKFIQSVIPKIANNIVKIENKIKNKNVNTQNASNLNKYK